MLLCFPSACLPICCSWEGPDCSVDVNECVRGLDDCDVNAACINTVGGFTCRCFETYLGNGRICLPDPLAQAVVAASFFTNNQVGWDRRCGGNGACGRGEGEPTVLRSSPPPLPRPTPRSTASRGRWISSTRTLLQAGLTTPRATTRPLAAASTSRCCSARLPATLPASQVGERCRCEVMQVSGGPEGAACLSSLRPPLPLAACTSFFYDAVSQSCFLKAQVREEG